MVGLVVFNIVSFAVLFFLSQDDPYAEEQKRLEAERKKQLEEEKRKREESRKKLADRASKFQ